MVEREFLYRQLVLHGIRVRTFLAYTDDIEWSIYGLLVSAFKWCIWQQLGSFIIISLFSIFFVIFLCFLPCWRMSLCSCPIQYITLYTIHKREFILVYASAMAYRSSVSDIKENGNNNTSNDVTKEKDHNVCPVLVWHWSLCATKCVWDGGSVCLMMHTFARICLAAAWQPLSKQDKRKLQVLKTTSYDNLCGLCQNDLTN